MATGHKYNDPGTGVECIEYNVYDHDCMQPYDNECTPQTYCHLWPS